MIKRVSFSPYNPVKFVKRDAVMPDSWGYVPFGKATYVDSLVPGQSPKYYWQPWNRTSQITIHVERSEIGETGNWTAVTILDCEGNELQVIEPTSYFTLPGNKWEDGVQKHTVEFRFTLAQYSALDDYDEVWFQVSFGYPSDVRIDYISANPMIIADRHEGVSEFKYRHDTNDTGVLFEQLGTGFEMMVYGEKPIHIPNGDGNNLEDQNSEIKQLSKDTWNSFKWIVGPMPPYLVEHLNTSLRAKYKTIDGFNLTLEDSANLERLGEETAALQHYSIMLRQAVHDESYTFNEETVTIFTIPSFPAAKAAHHMVNGGDSWGFLAASAIYNEAGLDSYVAFMNASIVTGYNKTGEFQKVIIDEGYRVVYINGEGEQYQVNWGATGVPVFTRHTTFTVQVTSVASPFSYRYEQQGNHLTDWGDNSGICEEFLNNLAGLKLATHTYATNGTKTVHIFSDDFILDLRIENQTNKLTNWGGQCPAGLMRMWMVDQNFSGLAELDLAPLATCRNGLQVLNLANSAIVKIKEGWSNFTPKAYTPLKTLMLQGNNMSVTNVTKIMQEYLGIAGYTGVAYTNTGVINIKQDPAAVIVDTATVNGIDTLTDPIPTGYGWAVVRDL